MILVFLYSCSGNNEGESDPNLIKVTTYDDIEKMKFSKGNICIVPEIHKDYTDYYIRSNKTGLLVQVDNEGVIKSVSFENETANSNFLRFAFTDEREAYFWRISNKKELTIKINKNDNSEFEIIKSESE